MVKKQDEWKSGVQTKRFALNRAIRERYHPKKFGDKTYYLYNEGYPHEEAEERAEQLRRLGFLVEVVHGKMSAALYVARAKKVTNFVKSRRK
jgi:hypothetical protein